MLTLGLMEGILSSAAGLLLLVGIIAGDAPMHKLLGPPVVGMLGFAAYLIHDAGEVTRLADLAGLGFFVLVGFLLPLGLMRYAWFDARASATQGEDRASRGAVAGRRRAARWGAIRPARTPAPAGLEARERAGATR